MLTRQVFSKVSSETASSWPVGPGPEALEVVPALAKRTLMGPHALTASACSRATSSEEERSAWMEASVMDGSMELIFSLMD